MEEQRRQWHPTPVLLSGKSHGWRSLVGYSPQGHEELDTTEWLHFTHLGRSPRVENGNQLQYSCLENSMDRGACQATVHGVTKSWTWLSNKACMHARKLKSFLSKVHRVLEFFQGDLSGFIIQQECSIMPIDTLFNSCLPYQPYLLSLSFPAPILFKPSVD